MIIFDFIRLQIRNELICLVIVVLVDTYTIYIIYDYMKKQKIEYNFFIILQ